MDYALLHDLYLLDHVQVLSKDFCDWHVHTQHCSDLLTNFWKNGQLRWTLHRRQLARIRVLKVALDLHHSGSVVIVLLGLLQLALGASDSITVVAHTCKAVTVAKRPLMLSTRSRGALL